MARSNSKQVLLALAKVSGFIALSVLAPQLPYAVFKAYLKEKSKEIDQKKLKQELKPLKTKGYIKFGQKDGETAITITERGKEKVLKYKLSEMKLIKPKKWDGIWRIVVFDIPEEKKVVREILRRKLKDLEFEVIQKSVFVTPHPCKEEIYYIKNLFGVHRHVNVIEASRLDEDNEDYFKGKFGLK